jgi:hypothetical protein
LCGGSSRQQGPARAAPIDHEWPHLLPGGTHVLFALRREGGSDIALLDLADNTWRVLLFAWMAAAYCAHCLGQPR